MFGLVDPKRVLNGTERESWGVAGICEFHK